MIAVTMHTVFIKWMLAILFNKQIKLKDWRDGSVYKIFVTQE